MEMTVMLARSVDWINEKQHKNVDGIVRTKGMCVIPIKQEEGSGCAEDQATEEDDNAIGKEVR